ncbi:Na+/H+ antiporter NhaC [Pelistega sp. NLN82]|uniref:Na+/H+ antiporter NhaC n=1 Tax=Pelistega ratti TaxID=2652177 RepID=A0A6L9Y3Y7_9BURK|nr:Na+/H+ antiporter NhaC [Pelistega ratti]NEN74865.1 Na+/H+ antiporter NhaC [Pelistega ratti]
MEKKSLIEMSPRQALFFATIIVAILGYTMINLEWAPQISLVLVICFLLLLGVVKKVRFKAMQDSMADGVMTGIGALYLFSFIGLLVSALMMSGAIPTLMYHGFDFISPHLFYVSAFVLTSIVGVAIGSSLTTCATIGVAFISMAGFFDANLAITAGAIVSGAFFGDKMSPLSDTCSIASSVVGIDLFEHIRNMMYTTVPAWILTVLFLWFLSPEAGVTDLSKVTVLQDQLINSGLVHDYALIPFVALVVLAVLKVHAIYTIALTIVLSIIITYIHSSPSMEQLGAYFFVGYSLPEGVDLGDVGKLLSRGGLKSMFFSQVLIIFALSVGGLLQALGILPALLRGIRHLITSAGRAVAAAALTSLGVNVLIGEQYLSILLSGNAFRPEFIRLGLHPKNLARTIEDAGTVINPLVPWSVCGVFISNVLGIAVLDYLPYAFFCTLSLVLTLIFGFTGLTISRLSPEEQRALA